MFEFNWIKVEYTRMIYKLESLIYLYTESVDKNQNQNQTVIKNYACIFFKRNLFN